MLNTVAEHKLICSTHVDEICWRIGAHVYNTHLYWKLCMLAICFSFCSHPTYTCGHLIVASEKYSQIFNGFDKILAAILMWRQKRSPIYWGWWAEAYIIDWDTLENFLMARYWPIVICIHCVTIIITIFTCLGTILPFPWKFSELHIGWRALLHIQWGQHHHFHSHQGVLIPSAHAMERNIPVCFSHIILSFFISFLPVNIFNLSEALLSCFSWSLFPSTIDLNCV
jgi:hypothetical protein